MPYVRNTTINMSLGDLNPWPSALWYQPHRPILAIILCIFFAGRFVLPSRTECSIHFTPLIGLFSHSQALSAFFAQILPKNGSLTLGLDFCGRLCPNFYSRWKCWAERGKFARNFAQSYGRQIRAIRQLSVGKIRQQGQKKWHSNWRCHGSWWWSKPAAFGVGQEKIQFQETHQTAAYSRAGVSCHGYLRKKVSLLFIVIERLHEKNHLIAELSLGRF